MGTSIIIPEEFGSGPGTHKWFGSTKSPESLAFVADLTRTTIGSPEQALNNFNGRGTPRTR
jgi:hypothetical protein